MNDTHNSSTWPELDAAFAAPSVVLTTFRRSGVGVSTGVWGARIDGRYLFTTPSSTGKVKRLSHTQRVTFGSGDRRGKAVEGPIFDAVARRVDGDVLPRFRAAMRSKGPIMSRVIEVMYKVKKDERLVYELTRN
jgi:uncharacterized protein